MMCHHFSLSPSDFVEWAPGRPVFKHTTKDRLVLNDHDKGDPDDGHDGDHDDLNGGLDDHDDDHVHYDHASGF